MKRPLYIRIAVLSFFILFLIAFMAFRSEHLDKRTSNDTANSTIEMTSFIASQDNTILYPIDSPPRKKLQLISEPKSVYNSFDTLPITYITRRAYDGEDMIYERHFEMFFSLSSSYFISRRPPFIKIKKTVEPSIKAMRRKYEWNPFTITDSKQRIRIIDSLRPKKQLLPSSISGIIISPQQLYPKRQYGLF